MIGEVYGRYTVVGTARRSGYVVCRCSCGVEKDVQSSTLRLGKSKSCGCARSEMLAVLNKKHGQSGSYLLDVAPSKEYRAWSAIKNRCYNPKNNDYAYYGARGITMHADWLDSFETFYAYLGPAPTPDYLVGRIRVDGNFEPGNVRWVTAKQQALVRLNAKTYVYQGQTYTAEQLALLVGIKEGTIRSRLARGWALADVVVKHRRRRN